MLCQSSKISPNRSRWTFIQILAILGAGKVPLWYPTLEFGRYFIVANIVRLV